MPASPNMLQCCRETTVEKSLKVPGMSEAAQEEEAYYEAEIAKMFAEAAVADERIAGNQAETARTRAETRVILDSVKANLEIV